MANILIDDKGISKFVDDNGVQGFVDDMGNLIGSSAPPPPPPPLANIRGARSYALPYVSRRLRRFHRPLRNLVLATAPPLVLTGKMHDKSGKAFDVTVTLSN